MRTGKSVYSRCRRKIAEVESGYMSIVWKKKKKKKERKKKQKKSRVARPWLRGEICSSPVKSGQGKKNQSPQTFFSPAWPFFPSFFFSLFFPLSPSFFLAPVSPPINAANKNNERPPARTLHPLVPVLIRSSSGERGEGGGGGSRYEREGGCCFKPQAANERIRDFVPILSPPSPLSLTLLFVLIVFLSFPSREDKEKKESEVRSRNRGFSND